MPDRDFAFCKLMYRSVRYEALGMGWITDYPYAGINLMFRFSDLTTAQVSLDRRGEPNHWVVALNDRASCSTVRSSWPPTSAPSA